MPRIKIRRATFQDGDDVTDLFMNLDSNRIMLGLDGHPILLHVEPRSDWGSSFYLTYLEVCP